MNSVTKNILIVCKYTIKELFHSKIFFNIAILGGFIILICYTSRELTYGVQQRVALDFGIGIASLSAVAIAIFLGAGLVYTEIEKRTLYMILSRPVSRVALIFGKIIGMLSILLINTLIIYVLSIVIYFYFGG